MDRDTKEALEGRERERSFLLRQMQSLEDDAAKATKDRDDLLKAFAAFVELKGSFDAETGEPDDDATRGAWIVLESIVKPKPVDDRQLPLLRLVEP
jgi:hypothetical protein